MARIKKHKRLVLERDQKCRICGTTEDLTLHHILPKGTKGRNLLINKTILCQRCHRYINEFWNKTEQEVQSRRGLLAGAGI